VGEFADTMVLSTRVATSINRIIDILTATKAPKRRLAKHVRHDMPAVLACARINQNVTDHVGQTEGIIEFTVGKQSSVGGDPGTMKLQLKATVKIKPQRLAFGFAINPAVDTPPVLASFRPPSPATRSPWWDSLHRA